MPTFRIGIVEVPLTSEAATVCGFFLPTTFTPTNNPSLVVYLNKKPSWRDFKKVQLFSIIRLFLLQ